MRTPDELAEQLNQLAAKSVNIVSAMTATAANPGQSVTFRWVDRTGQTQTATGTAHTPCSPGTVQAMRLTDGSWMVMGIPTINSRESLHEMRRRKEPPNPYGKVKILFSKEQGDKRVFYVGGDRTTPLKVASIPKDASLEGAWIDSLGTGNRYIVAVQWKQGSKRTLEVHGSKSWKVASEAGEAVDRATWNYYGYGYWSAFPSDSLSVVGHTPPPPPTVTEELLATLQPTANNPDQQATLVFVQRSTTTHQSTATLQVPPGSEWFLSGGGAESVDLLTVSYKLVARKSDGTPVELMLFPDAGYAGGERPATLADFGFTIPTIDRYTETKSSNMTVKSFAVYDGEIHEYTATTTGSSRQDGLPAISYTRTIETSKTIPVAPDFTIDTAGHLGQTLTTNTETLAKRINSVLNGRKEAIYSDNGQLKYRSEAGTIAVADGSKFTFDSTNNLVSGKVYRIAERTSRNSDNTKPWQAEIKIAALTDNSETTRKVQVSAIPKTTSIHDLSYHA